MATTLQSAEKMTPAELVNAARKEYGLTWDELGSAMGGRSGRMMRKIARGESSGESYRAALVELHQNGRVQHVPARRTDRSGKPVKVRAKRGAKTKTVAPKPVPEPTKTKPVAPRAAGGGRGKSGKGEPMVDVQYLPDGNRIETVRIPKSKAGQEEGARQMRARIVNLAKGTSHKDKRVKLRASVDVGGGDIRTVDIGSKGGYLINDVVSDVRVLNSGDMPGWINSQIADRYVKEMGDNAKVTGVTMTTFNAQRSKQERQRLDQTGTRRWNRRADGSRW